MESEEYKEPALLRGTRALALGFEGGYQPLARPGAAAFRSH